MNLGFNKAIYYSRTLIVIIPKLEKCLINGISHMEKHKPTKITVRILFLNEKRFDLFRAQTDNYNILPIETQNLESKYRQIKEFWLNEYERSLRKKKEKNLNTFSSKSNIKLENEEQELSPIALMQHRIEEMHRKLFENHNLRKKTK